MGLSETRPCGFKHGDPLPDEDDRMDDLSQGVCPLCGQESPRPCLGPNEATYCERYREAFPSPPLAREPTIPEPPSRGQAPSTGSGDPR